jgi:HK97 family phage major capsid protein
MRNSVSELIEIDYTKLAGMVSDNLKADNSIVSLLNEPALAKNGIVSPDGGNADQNIKSFPDFLISVIRNDKTRISSLYSTKAQYESDGRFGGFLVPPQYRDMINGIAVESAIIRAGATVIPIDNGVEMQAPLIDQTIAPGGGSAFLGGIQLYWTAEQGNITPTTEYFDKINLKVNKLGAYITVSSELLADASAISALLINKFGEAKAWFEDYNFFQGNGVGKPLGILNAPATYSVTRTTAAHFILADAQNMLARLPAASVGKAIWAINQSVLPDLMTMATSGNFVTFLPNLQGQPSMQLLGRPIYLTEKLPEIGTAGDVMLIDRSAYYILNRQDTTIATSDAPSFLTDQTTMRMISRLDGQPALRNQITLASGTYKVSPFVKLS